MLNVLKQAAGTWCLVHSHIPSPPSLSSFFNSNWSDLDIGFQSVLLNDLANIHQQFPFCKADPSRAQIGQR